MIKEIIIVFSCFLSTGIAAGQSVFKTVEITWQGYGDSEPAPFKKNEQRYYSIALAKDTQAAYMYPRVSWLVPCFDTLTAIKELLTYKGDTRICGTPVRGYCTICSYIYTGSRHYYSLQIQALYLINQLLYDPTLINNPYPVLFDKRNGKDMCVDEEGITRLFDAYIKWYGKAKHMTVDQIRSFGESPYRDAQVRWIR